ncbi:MAG TPA: ABC transporter substrate binding protein [Methylomirabilota bacterium]|jgi:hypothetical protein|nr:ABC transporter substrate binding protein [Methylomirabilota bacterium]
MERRAFVAGGLLSLVAPVIVRAQPAGKTMPRIGFLGNSDLQSVARTLEAFRQGRREVGWVENQTVTIEYRWAHGQGARVPELAAELVRTRNDVLVVSRSAAVQAARQATDRIPIVMAAVLKDPVAAGFVASLAHPGGNVTGLAASYEEIATKQVEPWPRRSQGWLASSSSATPESTSTEWSAPSPRPRGRSASGPGCWRPGTPASTRVCPGRRAATGHRPSTCFRARSSTRTGGS